MRPLALGLFAAAVSFFFLNVSACPKSTYTYQVVELPEPTLERLGEWIIKLMKRERGEKPETCYDRNSVYLRPMEEGEKIFHPVKMAGIFMHQYANAPAEVFIGVEDTEKSLRSNCTFNILISKDMALRRYVLRNTTDDSIFDAYLTEETLIEKVAKNKDWKFVDVVECTHYLHHLGSQYGKNSVTITVIDKNESEDQLRFSMLTFIGGFNKKGCVVSDDSYGDVYQ